MLPLIYHRSIEKETEVRLWHFMAVNLEISTSYFLKTIFHFFSRTRVSVDVKLTCVHGFISPLHDGPVYARHQPRSHHNAAQQPHYAVADPHHHVVEKEEVIEAVERLPEEEEEKL